MMRIFLFVMWLLVVYLAVPLLVPRLVEDLPAWANALWWGLGGFLTAVIAFFGFTSWKRVEEMHCIAVMRLGAFKRWILVYLGQRIDVEGSIGPLGAGEKLELPFHIGGLYLLGWWFDQSLTKKFTWFSPPEGSQKDLQAHDKEELSSFFVGAKDYADKLVSVPDSKNLALNIVYSWVVRLTNARKALIDTHDYIAVMYQFMQDLMRDGVRGITFAAPEAEEAISSLGPIILERARKEGLIEAQNKQYGFLVERILVRDIDPTNEADREALQRPLKEELTGKAEAARAKGEAEKEVTLAEAKAKVRTIGAEAEKTATADELAGAYAEMREQLLAKGVPADQVDALCKELRIVDMELDKDARRVINIEGAQGIEKAAIELGAVAGEIIGGFFKHRTKGGGAEPTKPAGEPAKEKPAGEAKASSELGRGGKTRADVIKEVAQKIQKMKQ